MTLPKSMANVIDNLQSKPDLKYLDIQSRLSELVFSSVVEPPKKDKALSTKSRARTVNQQYIDS